MEKEAAINRQPSSSSVVPSATGPDGGSHAVSSQIDDSTWHELACIFNLSRKSTEPGDLAQLTEGFAQLVAHIRKHSEETCASQQSFRELAEAIGAVFWLTDRRKKQIIYVSPGYEQVWGRPCAQLHANALDWFDAIHPEDRDRVAKSVPRQETGGYDEEYRIVRPDGSIRWIHDRAFPVRNQAGEVYRIAGMAEDITARKQIEKEVIEISDREQRRLGLDLHDGICQQLVSVAFAADVLRKDLSVKSPPDAVRLERITALLDNAILQARHLSQALYPMNLIGSGLVFSLRELAAGTNRAGQLACEVRCAEGVAVSDAALATHLYRIAQEAVHSAAALANPTRIEISLRQQDDNLVLDITDDGRNGGEDRQFGLGLSIMRHRANLAGGKLQVRRLPAGGTVVSISVTAPKPAPPPEANPSEVSGT